MKRITSEQYHKQIWMTAGVVAFLYLLPLLFKLLP